MADGQKLPFNQQVNRGAKREAETVKSLDGKNLPCTITAVNGSIVEAQAAVTSGYTIPKIKIPHVGAEWIRYPTQVGDKGMFISADASLNETSGLGGGKADLGKQGNLTPLAFLPIGNANWHPPTDQNKLEMYGKTGVIIKDSATGAVIVTIDSSGVRIHGGNVIIDDDCIISGISFKNHKHDDPQGGSVGVPHN